jgi:pyruvate dehydrogenase E2 component (dihydrolipoyllysine-residue acetyltransferase)
MATKVFMPALGMAQETGTLVRWLKPEGGQVARGEPLAEIMTDKATVELEAPADGVLAGVSAREGDEVPVGRVIAFLLASGESLPDAPAPQTVREAATSPNPAAAAAQSSSPANGAMPKAAPPDTQAEPPSRRAFVAASPLASRIAAEYQVDLAAVPTNGGTIQKADVLAFVRSQRSPAPAGNGGTRLRPASPKARRIAQERGIDLSGRSGSGPGGAILTRDVLAAAPAPALVAATPAAAPAVSVSPIWRIMAERTSQSWTTVPHFFLARDVNASGFVAWRERALKQSSEQITYTDMLVHVVAQTLRQHSRINARWEGGAITPNDEINIGLAVAVDEGLVVPVLHGADDLSLDGIARRRKDLIQRAQAGRLRPDDLQHGTFTISNLGMYGVDAFNAIINAPQAAILAVGRIADRVVAVNGQPAVQPMMTLSLSCDHRVVDGARGAQFLAAVADRTEAA